MVDDTNNDMQEQSGDAGSERGSSSTGETHLSNDEDGDQLEASQKKKLGFWGGLLVTGVVLGCGAALLVPRIEPTSSIGQRVASLPFVGDGSNAGQDSATEELTEEASASEDTGDVANTESASEAADTAVEQVAQAGDTLENTVEAEVEELAEADDEADNADEKNAEGESESNADAENADEGDEEAKEKADAENSEGDEATEGETATDDTAENAEVETLQTENEELRGEVETLQAQVQELSAQSEQATNTVASMEAISDLRVNVLNGASLETSIAKLEEAGVDVPAALSDSVESVPTSIDLQNEYGAYALSALRASDAATRGDGFVAQIGARISSEFIGRSLEPKEGNTPDAILSRGENALRSGDLEISLSELATLPSEAQQEMQPWIDQANKRLDVLKAVSDLADSIEAN